MKFLNNDARSLIQKRLDEIKLDKKDIFETLSNEIKNLLNQNNITFKNLWKRKNTFFNMEKSSKKKSFIRTNYRHYWF